MPKIQPPEDFVCPITQQLMIDPVQASDGHTYEREAIRKWFEKNSTSPMRNHLPNKDLVSNLFAKKIINHYLEQSNICTTEQFFRVVKEGHAEEFLKLNYLENHLEIKQEGLTALHVAAKEGHEALTKLLLQEGASIDAPDEGGDHKGNTPLIWAACCGHLTVARILLEGGAKIEHADNAGWTPLHWAANRNQIDVTKLLLDKKANLEAKNNAGQTPLHLAAKNGSEDMVKLLLERGASYHVTDGKNFTPSQLAQANNPKLARLIPKYRQHLKIAKLKTVIEQQQAEIEALKLQSQQSLPKIQQDGSSPMSPNTDHSLAYLISLNSSMYSLPPIDSNQSTSKITPSSSNKIT